MAKKVLKSNRNSVEPSFRIKKKVNTIINKFKDFTEIIHYKKPFDVVYRTCDYNIVDSETGEKLKQRQRNFILDGDTLKPLRDGITIEQIKNSFSQSAKRAKDNFYGYGLCNSWSYFCSFTINRSTYAFTDEDSKYYWSMFKQKLQRYFPSVKILCIPERHKKSGVYNLHFHALLGACNIDGFLRKAINPKTGQYIIKNGRQVYNLDLWGKGFSTVVKIDENETQIQVVNYLLKYVTKENNIGYNQKKYYRTTNLDFKNKHLSYCNFKELEDDIALDKFQVYKKNHRMTVLRRYH